MIAFIVNELNICFACREYCTQTGFHHNIQLLHTEHGPFSIVVISTASTSRLPRQDKPKGSNSNNLKTLPKLKSDITSGTNVCLWNARLTRKKYSTY